MVKKNLIVSVLILLFVTVACRTTEPAQPDAEPPAPTDTPATALVPGVGEPVPYLVCQESTEWERPADDVQQQHLDEHPRFKGAEWADLKDRLKGIHVQVQQRSPQVFRDFLDIEGLWAAPDDLGATPDCAFNLSGKVEVWFVLREVVSITSPEAGVVVIVLDPTERGFQSIHMNLADLTEPGARFELNYVDDHGEQLAPPTIYRREAPAPDA